MRGKLIKKVAAWRDNNLRRLLGRLSPERRIILIVIMLITFSVLSIFMTFSSIYNLGKEKGEKMHMEHIGRLQFELKKMQQPTDSLKLQNNFQYDRK